MPFLGLLLFSFLPPHIIISFSFILSEERFICGVREEFYLISLNSDGAIDDVVKEIRGIQASKEKEAVWKLVFNGEDKFSVEFKDGKIKEVTLNKTCFVQLENPPEIFPVSSTQISINFVLPPGNFFGFSATASGFPFSKVNIIKEKEKISVEILYTKFQEGAYEDSIFFSAVSNSSPNIQYKFFYIGKVPIPEYMVVSGVSPVPNSQGKIIVGKRETSFVSDNRGRFNVAVPIFLDDREIKIVHQGEGGKTNEEVRKVNVKRDYLQRPLIIVERLGNKLVIFGSDEKVIKDISFKKVSGSQNYTAEKLGKTAIVFIPQFGRYIVEIQGKNIEVNVERIPYRFIIFTPDAQEKEIVRSKDGREIRIKVGIQDITGQKVEPSEFPYIHKEIPPRKVELEISGGIGGGINAKFKRFSFKNVYSFLLMFPTGKISPFLGVEGGFVSYPGNIDVLQIFSAPVLGVNWRAFKFLALRLAPAFPASFIKLEGGGFEKDLGLFGFQPSLSFILGKEQLLFGLSFSYMHHVFKTVDLGNIEFDVKELNSFFSTLRVSYVF
jgi:hypothetical protein